MSVQGPVEASSVVIPGPQPSARRVLAEPAQPVRTPEMIDHGKQVIDRPRQLDRAMMGFAAVGVSPGVRNLRVEGGGIADLGTFTYFSLRRVWGAGADGRTGVVSLLYAGYKARREGGRIVIGGAANNVCAYDLRFRPFDGASDGGKILNSRKRTTIRLGLILDEAAERAAKGVGPVADALQLPRFWAGFRADALPEVEDCPAARRLALGVARGEAGGPPLACLRSPGGMVTNVHQDPDGSLVVGFGPDVDTPEACAVLPRTAVLRPYVRAGTVIQAGTPLADFLPRRTYPNMGMIARLYGEDVAARLLEEVVTAADEQLGGLRCRPVELCPGQFGQAVRLFEDVRHLTAEDGTVRPQVVRVRADGVEPLRPARDGVVAADFAALRPDWVHKFQPARR